MNDLSSLLDFDELGNPTTFDDINMPNGPDLWDAILDRLNCPGAVVAGGAVRDYFLGVPPKDIDIFVCAGVLNPPNCFASLGDDERAEEYEGLPNIQAIMRGEIAGLQIDLVGVDPFASGFELVETFDFGISRCFYCGMGVAIGTPEFHWDRAHQEVSLLIGDRRERAQRRFDRFNERMGGGWTLVDRT